MRANHLLAGRLAIIAGAVAFASTLLAGDYDPLALDAAKSKPAHNDVSFLDQARGREIPLRIYLPAGTGAAPVILFSHGLGGSRAGSVFLGEHWAGRGFVAVYVQHPGSDESVWKDTAPQQRLEAMNRAASMDNFLARVKDVPATLNQLELWNKDSTNFLHGRLDLSRIGMSGHSFGALTTEAVSGETMPIGGQRFTDPRIKAAIIMSPSAPRGGDVEKAFASVKVPWLLMTGTKDLAPIGNADMKSRLSVYPALRGAPKYELVLNNAEHSVFTDRALPGESEPRNPNHHRAILALTTAFLDAYLRGDAAALQWLNGSGPRAILESQDQWQHSLGQ
jgi:predicted dienelactone hydrolase